MSTKNVVLTYAQRAGSHFIVFIENPDTMVIFEFLHGRSDLAGRLARLPESRQ